MKLKKVRIRNFRCYKDEIVVDFEDITALVGKNDAGKSTILDALDIFLNDNDPDKDDASKGGNAGELEIVCEFVEFPNEIILDDENPSSLESEYLLNEEKRLEIHKKYSGDLQKPKCKSIEAYALHPNINGASDLLQLKNSELKTRARELGVNLDDTDQRANPQIRSAIRKKFSNLNLTPSFVPLNANNANKIWTELKKYLPIFALFKSDRSSTDQDAEAQDPLKAAIKEALKIKEAELNSITEFIRGEVQKIANSTLEKLSELDNSLASQLNPTFSPPKWDSIFKASITSDDDIPINKRGSGVKRLILLSFFRAKAEQLSKESGGSEIIFGIEEPETSQHPNNQRLLFRALSDLSLDAQVIISTHTPVLARALPDKCLRYIYLTPEKTRQILIGGKETNKMMAESLGVLPDHTVKLFVGVEGLNDINFLRNTATALINDGNNVIDLEKLEEEGKIIFIPCGGSNLAYWVSRLANLNIPEFHLYDRDTTPPQPANYQKYCDEINARSLCKAFITEKKEIENYLHKDAIKKAYANNKIEIDIPSNFGSFDDVPLEVAKLVHKASNCPKQWDELAEDKKEKKISYAKKTLCFAATKLMTTKLLEEIDNKKNLLFWFSEMKLLIQENSH